MSRPLSKGLCDTVKRPDQPSLSLPPFCPNTADCCYLFSHSSSATQLVCPSQLCRESNSRLFGQNACATHPKRHLQLYRERQDGTRRSFFCRDSDHSWLSLSFSHSSSATQLVCPSQLCRGRNRRLFGQNDCATHLKRHFQLCRGRRRKNKSRALDKAVRRRESRADGCAAWLCRMVVPHSCVT